MIEAIKCQRGLELNFKKITLLTLNNGIERTKLGAYSVILVAIKY